MDYIMIYEIFKNNQFEEIDNIIVYEWYIKLSYKKRIVKEKIKRKIDLKKVFDLKNIYEKTNEIYFFVDIDSIVTSEFFSEKEYNDFRRNESHQKKLDYINENLKKYEKENILFRVKYE